ncbi:MAG: GNAT family N-acetyltransferase [Desulfovibrionaceae bacterium]
MGAMLPIVSVSPDEMPMRLLLEADPSEHKVKEYLKESLCYLALKSGVAVGVCVLGNIAEDTLELHNIAVCPSVQGQGIGAALLRHVIEEARAEGFRRIELGTGTFGYQLAFYQRVGFRVEGVIRDFFVDHYDEPIFELGIQLKDMLRLALVL